MAAVAAIGPVLRARLIDVSGGGCEWPACSRRGEQAAHVEPRGMGGRPSVDRLDNLAWLCREHHDKLDLRIRISAVDLRDLGLDVEEIRSVAFDAEPRRISRILRDRLGAIVRDLRRPYDLEDDE